MRNQSKARTAPPPNSERSLAGSMGPAGIPFRATYIVSAPDPSLWAKAEANPNRIDQSLESNRSHRVGSKNYI